MRVAVVSHGPSMVGAGCGGEIDSCDLVVRFHDCHYQFEKSTDYGTKYDFGILPGPWLQKALNFSVFNPTVGWLIYRFQNVQFLAPPNSETFDLDCFNDISREKGKASGKKIPNLSRGFCALVIACRKWPNAQIIGYGFDALLNNLGVWEYSEDYLKMYRSVYTADEIKRIAHDCSLEHDLLKKHYPAILVRP